MADKFEKICDKLRNMSIPDLPPSWTQEAATAFAKAFELAAVSQLLGDMAVEKKRVELLLKLGRVTFNCGDTVVLYKKGMLGVCVCTVHAILTSSAITKLTMPEKSNKEALHEAKNVKVQFMLEKLESTLKHIEDNQLELPTEMASKVSAIRARFLSEVPPTDDKNV